MYAKLINGVIQFAPTHITIDDKNIWNATTEQMLSAGWKTVIFSEAPTAPEGYYYESGWEEDESTITQTWTLTPLPDDIDDATAFAIIFGDGTV